MTDPLDDPKREVLFNAIHDLIREHGFVHVDMDARWSAVPGRFIFELELIAEEESQ